MRQLVSILLDNAVKYALPDSPIEFSLEKAKRGVVLRSSNACEDVAPENAQKLFDRFYRADQSRSSGSGFGIGLSIARSISEGHHGSIRAIADDGKITFTAELK
ncbi:GHKL domain-containing protein [bacterium]|nr:GHKL domain-containing protein [bacterium]